MSDAAPTVFFLSDYGTQDEFVGMVHAVVLSGAPGVTIVDLTHHIAPFDVVAGSRTLVRAAPYVGPGLGSSSSGRVVVLAVVDPGVATARRGIVLEVTRPSGHVVWFVGPDNGLLVAGAGTVAAGGSVRAVALPAYRAPAGVGATFDGRDVFAPAAAALCRGVEIEALGSLIEPADLVRLPAEFVECAADADGQWTLRAEVMWIDAFGNAQLAVRAKDVEGAGLESARDVQLVPASVRSASVRPASVRPASVRSASMRLVTSFGELASGEPGLLWDANGHLSLVAGQASAATLLDLTVGNVVHLVWSSA